MKIGEYQYKPMFPVQTGTLFLDGVDATKHFRKVQQEK